MMSIRKTTVVGIVVLSAVWTFTSAALPALGAPYIVGTQSQDALANTLRQNPDNYASAYLLGKIHADQGNLAKAIEMWEQYLAAAPKNDPKRPAVRERLTVLRLQRAAEFARRAARGDLQVSQGEMPENTLAVLNFLANSDDPDIVALSKGVTAMIITDLAKVPALKVVEREKMAALMREIRLGQTGLLDEKTALKSGRMLLARHLVQGNLSSEQQTDIQISSKVLETINAATLGSPDAQGSKQQIFALEKQLVFDILAALGMEELDEETRNAIKKQHTSSLEALLNYSRGLTFFDQGEFARAKDAFQTAITIDPQFDLAAEALANTPGTVKEIEKYDLEMLDYVMAEEEIVGRPETDGGSVILDLIEIVDPAQDQIAMEAHDEEEFYHHNEETPGFPDRPDVEEPGRIQIEW